MVNAFGPGPNLKIGAAGIAPESERKVSYTRVASESSSHRNWNRVVPSHPRNVFIAAASCTLALCPSPRGEHDKRRKKSKLHEM